MTKDEALELALNALHTKGEHHPRVYAAIAAIQTVLAQPVQEPVAWLCCVPGQDAIPLFDEPSDERYPPKYKDPLYTIPPAAQPVQEPVAWLYPEGLQALQAGKCWTAYPRSHEDCNIPLYIATPPQQQAEPVTWDKPSASFNDWWDSDRRRDNANPFTTDSFAYWAWEGWQAAQRPWVGLTDEEIEDCMEMSIQKTCRAVGAKLKERNK